MRNNKWTTSIDGELFMRGDEFDTKEEAIVEFRKEIKEWEKQPSEFYVGKIELTGTGEFVDGESILEDISVKAQDEVGEAAEDWLTDISNEESEELGDIIIKWLEDHGYKPTFFRIKNVEKVLVSP